MRIDRDAAAVVDDREKAVGLDLDLDEMGVAGERLVHGIVDHLGEQVVHRLLVGAADIHAGPPAHRLEPFEHLDVAGGVAALGAGGRARGLGGGFRRGRARRAARAGRTGRARRRRCGSGLFCGLGHAVYGVARQANRAIDYATVVAAS